MNKNDIELVENALKQVPDNRNEKIEEVKKRLKSGWYEDNQDKIIEKILEKFTKAN